MTRLVAVACLAVSGVAGAQAALEARLEACAGHADQTARLTCFDLEVERLRLSARAAPPAGAAPASVARTPPAASPLPAPVAPAQAAAAPMPVPPQPAAAAPASDPFALRQGPTREEQRNALLTARAVKASPTAGGPELRIELDNGQVWVENEHKSNLSIADGEEVQIKPASMGSFVLLARSGLSTRVRRIK